MEAQRENALYDWWTALQMPANFILDNGAAVKVLSTGLRNEFEGPDFYGCVIEINGARKTGAVEFHVKSGDWYRHNHDKNPLYNKTILHICLFAEKNVIIRKANSRKVPQLTLDAAVLPQSDIKHPCYNPDIDVAVIKNILTTFAEKRIARKKSKLLWRIKRYGRERSFIISVAEALGYIRNKKAMFLLSKRLTEQKHTAFAADTIDSLEKTMKSFDFKVRPNNSTKKRITALLAFMQNFEKTCNFDLRQTDFNGLLGKNRFNTIYNNVSLFYTLPGTKAICAFLEKTKIHESTRPFRVLLAQIFGTYKIKALQFELYQQGAIELYNNFCVKGKCAGCPLGQG